MASAAITQARMRIKWLVLLSMFWMKMTMKARNARHSASAAPRASRPCQGKRPPAPRLKSEMKNAIYDRDNHRQQESQQAEDQDAEMKVLPAMPRLFDEDQLGLLNDELLATAR